MEIAVSPAVSLVENYDEISYKRYRGGLRQEPNAVVAAAA